MKSKGVIFHVKTKIPPKSLDYILSEEYQREDNWNDNIICMVSNAIKSREMKWEWNNEYAWARSLAKSMPTKCSLLKTKHQTYTLVFSKNRLCIVIMYNAYIFSNHDDVKATKFTSGETNRKAYAIRELSWNGGHLGGREASSTSERNTCTISARHFE